MLAKAEKILSEKIERNKLKGVHIPIRLMVIGVPNCGKSTLINNVCANKKTETSVLNKPRFLHRILLVKKSEKPRP